MKLGVAYYPEREERSLWDVHYKKIVDAGISVVRMAEFAWSRLEPEEGIFRWDWLDESIELAESYGLKVILCTPTAAPPIWLVEKNPEVLPVDEEGNRMVFGKRQHRCYHSQKYREYSFRIVEKMAERYGSNPTVIAWQLDNEFGGERTKCYCSLCQTAFQNYLAEKYKDIRDLNQRWGNAFWSQDYQRFDQIKVPMRIDNQLWLKHNPSLEMEFWRFSSQSIIDYCNGQAAIIRRYSSKIITTNTDQFYYGDSIDLRALFKGLDKVGIDIYCNDLCELSFYADLAYGIKDSSYWIMEFGVENKSLKEEMVLVQNKRCEYLGFFKLCPFPWGQEQGPSGLLTFSGNPTPSYHVIQEMSKATRTECHPARTKIGLYYDFESSWSYTISTWAPKEEKWLYPRYMLNTVYKSLYDSQLDVRFIFHSSQIEDMETVIVPWHVLYDPELEQNLIDFVHAGGNLVVTSDLFIKNSDNVFMSKVPPIYPTVLGWQEPDFINTGKTGSAILATSNYGKGRAWILHKDAGYEEWKGWMLDYTD